MTSSVPRCCDVYELARQGRVIEGEFSARELPRLAGYLADSNAALRYRIEGRLDDRGRPCALLRVTGRLALECQRCGLPLTFHLERDGEFRFVATEEELNALPIEGDDDAEPIVGSHSLDVAAWVEDEAILSLPLVPRHDDCRAQIPAEAASEAETRPNPFAVLADLKVGRKPH